MGQGHGQQDFPLGNLWESRLKLTSLRDYRLEVKRTDMGQLSQGWAAGMWRQKTARKRLKQFVLKKGKAEAAYT
jgi:hypothetical protein